MKAPSNVLVWLLLWTASCGGGQPSEAELEELFVGVVPYGLGKAHASCASPYALSISFEMDDENDTMCSYESGDWGEGTWVTPDAIKPALTHPCGAGRPSTRLNFCRVAIEKDTFRPLTSDPQQTEDFYAVLLLGERCPAGSVQILKRIYNEDNANKNAFYGAAGTQAPNEITSGIHGAQTTLNFCFFRSASSGEETMSQFPELGFHYGVFHDFDVAPPGWVLAKRWQLSDDSNNNSRDQNYYQPRDAEETLEFMKIIENPTRGGHTDTYFDMAQVR